MAEDYEGARKIRALVEAAEAKGDADTQWIAWAKAKADWYDPMIAATDEFFGKRDHGEDAEQKTLKEQRSGYWW